MLDKVTSHYLTIEKLLKNYGLSSQSMPTDLKAWQDFLAFLEKRETQIRSLQKICVDIPDALVFIFDEDMIIVAANTEAAQSLGFESEYEIIGKQALTFVKDDDYEASLVRFNTVLNGEELPEYDRTLVRPDGRVIHTILNLSLIKDADSGTRFVKSVMHDVTNLREAEAEAQRHQQNLNKVLENAPVALWACDSEGFITLSHGHALESMGRESGELVGTNLFTFYAEYPHIIEHIKKALNGEKQHIKIELNQLVFDARFHPIFEDNEVVGIVGVSTDITDLANAQQHIQTIQASTARTRDYLQAIINNSSDGIAVASLDGSIENTNPAFNQLLGLESHDLYGHKLENYIDESEKETMRNTINYAISSRQSVRFEARIFSESIDLELITDILCSPLLTDEDEVYGIVFSIRDISAYRDLLHSLAESRDEALQVSRLKSEFLAMMSHEVRTPLHAIMGVTEMMQDTILKTEQHELIDLIQEQSYNLLKMLNSILDYSKLEAQKMILERRAFKIKDFMEVVTKQFKGQAWNKDIVLHLSIEVPNNLYIYGDVQRLRQVITAFTSNAIKFTEKGEVIVACILLEKTDREATLQFRITDTGIGISEDKIQTLFSPFIQADSSHTRHYGGTGLGLAIAHRILKLMKSKIRIQSEVNKGTSFEFVITFDLEID